MDININEVDVHKLSLNPGDIVVVKIKSADMTADILAQMKKSFEDTFFPYGVKVVLFGMGPDDDVSFDQITENKKIACGTQSYCVDCSCGKKERIQNG